LSTHVRTASTTITRQTALCWRGLKRLDADAIVSELRLALLRAVRMFAPLSLLMVERLATSLKWMDFVTGDEVFHQGDVGDNFYIIAEGEVEITVKGRTVGKLGPGDYFGEIALIRDVPRTESATARSEATLVALGRDKFVAAVTGVPKASRRRTR
jgi:CRP-like cAMP-binding protein